MLTVLSLEELTGSAFSSLGCESSAENNEIDKVLNKLLLGD